MPNQIAGWDRGDSAGSNGTNGQRTQLTQFIYQTNPSNWLNPNLSSCINTKSTGTGRYTCVYGANYTHVWTTY